MLLIGEHFLVEQRPTVRLAGCGCVCRSADALFVVLSAANVWMWMAWLRAVVMAAAIAVRAAHAVEERRNITVTCNGGYKGEVTRWSAVTTPRPREYQRRCICHTGPRSGFESGNIAATMPPDTRPTGAYANPGV